MGLAQSWKHVMNQPAELHLGLVKAMLNPTGRQWMWVARNVRLRSFLLLGSPRGATACPAGMTDADVAAVRHSVTLLLDKAEALPLGCKALRREGPGAPADQTMIVDGLEWSWDRLHERDSFFDFVLSCLGRKHLSGVCEAAGGEEADDKPAAQPTMGVKRTVRSRAGRAGQQPRTPAARRRHDG